MTCEKYSYLPELILKRECFYFQAISSSLSWKMFFEYFYGLWKMINGN